MSDQTVITRNPKNGQACIYVDTLGVRHDALITRVWGPTGCNLLYVTDDVNQTDSWGHKIIRESSCMHGSVQPAHGNYWILPYETK